MGLITVGWAAWTTWTEWLASQTGFTAVLWSKLLLSVALLVAYLGAKRVLRRSLARRIEEPQRRYRVFKSLSLSLSILALFTAGRIWIFGQLELSTYLGILSAGLAVALADPITNLAGWLYILWRHPMRVGDRIEFGDVRGDVVDVTVSAITLLEVGGWVDADQSTGRMIHVPNGKIFKEPCINYSAGFDYIWDELPVVVTFESDWELGLKLLTDIVEAYFNEHEQDAANTLTSAGRKHFVHYSHVTPIVWVDVVDIGVRLTMRYLCKVRTRRRSRDLIWRAVLHAFAAHDRLDFAYPTQRFFDHAREGKMAMRPPGTPQPALVPPVADSATTPTAAGDRSSSEA